MQLARDTTGPDLSRMHDLEAPYLSIDLIKRCILNLLYVDVALNGLWPVVPLSTPQQMSPAP
jgi:hypothetical protein